MRAQEPSRPGRPKACTTTGLPQAIPQSNAAGVRMLRMLSDHATMVRSCLLRSDARELSAAVVSTSTSRVSGIVRDETGGVLPGVSVGCAATDRLSPLPALRATISSRVSRPALGWFLPCSNFAVVRRGVTVPPADVWIDVTLPGGERRHGDQDARSLPCGSRDPARNLVGRGAVSQPGRDHLAAAGRASDDAVRRVLETIGRRHQPAQR